MKWSRANANLLGHTMGFASAMMDIGKKSPNYMQSENFKKFLSMQIRPGRGAK